MTRIIFNLSDKVDLKEYGINQVEIKKDNGYTFTIFRLRPYFDAPEYILKLLVKRYKRQLKAMKTNNISIAGTIVTICSIEDEIELRTLPGYDEYNKNWVRYYKKFTLPQFKKAKADGRKHYKSEFKVMFSKFIERLDASDDLDLAIEIINGLNDKVKPTIQKNLKRKASNSIQLDL